MVADLGGIDYFNLSMTDTKRTFKSRYTITTPWLNRIRSTVHNTQKKKLQTLGNTKPDLKGEHNLL